MQSVRAFEPIAVLRPPVVFASKAFDPRTVLSEPEFAPLPTVTLLIVASAVNVPVVPDIAAKLAAPPNVEIPDTIIFPSTLILAATPGLAPISIPFLAVTKPTESIFVTSSYVRVPAIPTSPLNVPLVAITFPVSP